MYNTATQLAISSSKAGLLRIYCGDVKNVWFWDYDTRNARQIYTKVFQSQANFLYLTRSLPMPTLCRRGPYHSSARADTLSATR
ncbi:unnamed protein product [Acanthoscelides obtectus]|uniref:Uncharacterized protein n=1 Tax=Acanthoscelides obtectus TaxID=200917 RepID=A0A9P0MD23_ACAOB|nr:unnamed protein product [Acanthoscelides obtectus]CAK1629914.1 hypothetical protein AOBTE_LOCUS6036 [Acanthoscelides obtectus]